MTEFLWFLSGFAAAVSATLIACALARRARRRGSRGGRDATPVVEGQLARELLDDASHTLESLAGSVGNELANLSSGVVCHAQQLCEALGEPHLVAARADRLRASVFRLRLFSEKILSFARSEPLEVAPLHVRSFLAGIGQEIENHSGNRSPVVVETSAFLPRALASERALRNALMFLVDTLFALETRASRLSIRACAQPSDDDTYIEIDLCAEADDPNQPQRSVKPAVQLGYLAARNLLEAQGARLSFRRLEGLSVSCSVALQALAVDDEACEAIDEADAPERVTELPASRHPFGGVLVLEGEESIRSLVSQEIENSGRNIVTCLDGAAARSLLRATPERFELLLLADEARLEDGVSIARLALDYDPAARVLLLTSGDPREVLLELPGRNVRVLVKPFDIGELRRSLRELITAESTPLAS